MMDKSPIASWLVDVGYVVKASENRFKLDYLAARALLRERFGPLATVLFNGYDPNYGVPAGLRAFYDAMAREGMQIRLQPMQSGSPGTNRQRRVDVDICAHLVWQASLPAVKTVILTTGDQDFVPAVLLARQRLEAKIALFTYSAHVHPDLEQAADLWLKFEDYRAFVRRNR